jgi:hypothetical protein
MHLLLAVSKRVHIFVMLSNGFFFFFFFSRDMDMNCELLQQTKNSIQGICQSTTTEYKDNSVPV